MDRNEAVLRELNLYPQWVLREPPAAEADHAATAVMESAPPATVPLETPVVSAQIVQAAAISADSVALERVAKGVVEPMPREAEPLPVVAEHESAYPHDGAYDDITPDERGGDEYLPSEPEKVREPFFDFDWPRLKQTVHDCNTCGLRAGCTQTVFGTGDEQADWLFVGEGPGEDEDARGEPFAGQAGRLLDNMLLALKLKRSRNVYIANVVKCRPPDNRVPHVDEVAACLPYLQRQIQLIQPKVIVALGKTAATALLGSHAALGPLRGHVHDYLGTPLIATYHPAYLLRSPQDKAKAWRDLCLAQQVISEKS